MQRFRLMLVVGFVAVAACGGGSAATSTSRDAVASASPSAASQSATTSTASVNMQTPVELAGTGVDNHGLGDATGGSIEVQASDDGAYGAAPGNRLPNNFFSPSFIKGNPGETVSVHVTNTGHAAHTFTVFALGVDTGRLEPGQSATVSVTLPQSGATAFLCNLHLGSGMKGAFYFNVGDQVNH